jgi:hypothetical protein
MNDPRARQLQFNAESSGQWEGFAEHRRHVTGWLECGPGRLCILGAGNCNDLDLITLLDAHREVHLVDLDTSALGRGAGRQGVADRPGLVLHGGLDVTGMLDAITRWSPLEAVAPADLQALVDWPASRVAPALPGPFDVVASTCLLSQLVGNASQSLGEGHAQLGQVVSAIRMGHLRLLARLVRPGGKVVVITDYATSERCPEIAEWSDQEIHSLDLLARSRGLIRGVDPSTIVTQFRRDPVLSAKFKGVTPLGPWRWRLHARVYLVQAIAARARAVP